MVIKRDIEVDIVVKIVDKCNIEVKLEKISDGKDVEICGIMIFETMEIIIIEVKFV